MTIAGVGDAAPPLPVFGPAGEDALIPGFQGAPEPSWAPPRAEPGDMGWDLVYGVKRSMGTNVQPRYNFAEDDDEPTSEIALPHDVRRP